jgi:hypothetical protein
MSTTPEHEVQPEPQADTEETSITGSTESSTWTTGQEELLKAISERSNCMRWLHTQSQNYFESVNFYLTIPNVIISTLNGGFTMSLTALFPDPNSQKAATTVIGLISILTAVFITLNQYIKSQQMMEAHRTSGISQAKLYRMITNELAVRRDQRSNAIEFLKLVKIEQDRLENTSPSIRPHIIEKFNIQFKDRDIEKPEITGDLDTVNVNKRSKKGKNLGTPLTEDKQNDSPEPKTIFSNITSIVKGKTLRNVASFSKQNSESPRLPNIPSSGNVFVEVKKN